MRALLAVSLGLVAALPAIADAASYEAVHGAGAWAGCVDQPGFQPYPVQLVPTMADGKRAFTVIYPDSCEGMHVPDAGEPGDATEIISTYPSTCIFKLAVDYHLVGETLHLTYRWDGAVGARATLDQSDAVSACTKSGATS